MYSTRSLIGSSTLPFLLRSALDKTRALSVAKSQLLLPSILVILAPNYPKEISKSEMEDQEAASFSPQKQLRLSLHPGDEYVESLEPESLQVLVNG